MFYRYSDWTLINWNPDPPPPWPSLPLLTPSQGGGMWGVFMVFEGTIRPLGVGDFSGFALHMHSPKWRSEVGIWLVPSFLTVISSGDILREILRLIVKENSFQFNGKQYLTNPWYCHGHKDSSFLCQSHWDCVFDTVVYRQGTRFNEKSILDVKTHFKQKETFQNTHFTSPHPPSVKKGFFKGEALRILRTNSSETTFEEIISNFKKHLMNRGYPHTLI